MVDNRVFNATRRTMVAIGTRVEIRNQRLQTWCRGFQIAAIIGETYLIRRLADGQLLPRFFDSDDIRLTPGGGSARGR